MKRNFSLPVYFLAITLFLTTATGFAQLNNSGFHARFGVDADTKTDFIKYGATTGVIESDDWFSTSSHSIGVIDTSNASVYRSNLMSGVNISFVKRMSVPLYYKSNNTMWIDAVYSRDYVKGTASTDLTAFVSSAGNMDDPAIWKGGPSNVATKTDLVDVFAHMRRDGTNIKDSLWLFTAASTIGTTGSRYYDIELYKNRMSFNPMTGNFSTGGPDEGHTQWKFDASGKVTQTGDMIIGVTYSPGEAPVIEIRLWVAKSVFSSVNPALFNFGINFDAYSTKSVYGYGNIVSKSGSTAFGSGVGNYSSTSTDTTYSTPWGTTGTAWNSNYESLQLVEMGINLSRIGVDPALYSTLGTAACGTFFKSIFFKSRSSGSFAANLTDFVGPLDFLNVPTLDYTVQPDTLSCKKQVGLLPVTAKTTAASYTWKPLNGGHVNNANADSSDLFVDKPGTYVVNGAVASGCPVTRRDTIVVPEDLLQPVAEAAIGADGLGQVQLFGGDSAASNKLTSFGRSKGLEWEWAGPGGFTSNVQNPYINNNWGTYTLTVTEKRNGCTSTATITANISVLPVNRLQATASRYGSVMKLKWSDIGENQVSTYAIERKSGSGEYTQIGIIHPSGMNKPYSFVDAMALIPEDFYRIKALTRSGVIYYSNILQVKQTTEKRDVHLAGNYPGNKLNLVVEGGGGTRGRIIVTTITGSVLYAKDISFSGAYSTVELPVKKLHDGQMVVVAVFVENELAFSEKVIL